MIELRLKVYCHICKQPLEIMWGDIVENDGSYIYKTVVEPCKNCCKVEKE